jgi:hypothetical protein
MDMERAWFAARRAVAGRRRHSRAAMAVNNAAVPLEGFCAAGFAVELPSREAAAVRAGGADTRARAGGPPRRMVPGCGRGRPAAIPLADPVTERPPLPERALTPVE